MIRYGYKNIHQKDMYSKKISCIAKEIISHYAIANVIVNIYDK